MGIHTPAGEDEMKGDSMSEHICRIDHTCRCWIAADSPNEDCPMHGWAVPRCGICGRFMSWKRETVNVRFLREYDMEKIESFDGETYCPECSVLICAYCQGQDACHHTRLEKPLAIHAVGCSYLEPRQLDEATLREDRTT